MKTCPTCRAVLASNAATCPHCGRQFRTHLWIALAVIIALIVVVIEFKG